MEGWLQHVRPTLAYRVINVINYICVCVTCLAVYA
jgi:hypothetical protein